MTDYTNRCGYNERYKQRRAIGKPGWSDNYEEKAKMVLEILQQNGISSGGRFLELGCGAGNITLFMAEHGFEAYGIDIIPEAIDWAKDRMKETSAKASFCVGNVVDLRPYSDNFFDFVWDKGCLHCIIGPDRTKCIANIFRVVKLDSFFWAGASLVNEIIVKRFEISPDSYFDPKSRCVMRNGIPFYYLSTEDEFLKEIQETGFHIKNCEKKLEQSDKDPYKIGEISVLATKKEDKTG